MNTNKRVKRRKTVGVRRRKPQGGKGEPIPRNFGAVLLPPNHKAWLSWRNLATVVQAGSVGANSTFLLYVPQTMSPTLPGLSAFFGQPSTNGLYNSCRLLAVKSKLTAYSLEGALVTRVALVLSSNTPTNNSLSTAALQQPVMSRTASAVAETSIGPLTGNGRCVLTLQASNARNLGVRNVKGIADPYTNYWDSTADAFVVATNGISLQILTLANANQVLGVVVDVECDLLFEFFSLNPVKTL